MTSAFFDEPFDVDTVEGIDRALTYVRQVPDISESSREDWTHWLLEARTRLTG